MPDANADAGRLDVYLLPSVIGGGLGDVSELHAMGSWLRSSGFPVTLYRPLGRPWPRGLPGPFRWPARKDRLSPRADRALTVSSQFGITCASGRDEPLGRAGPWSEEVRAIEERYGPDATLHVSLEEFARTLTSAQQLGEILREGGATRTPKLGRPAQRRRLHEFHDLYRKFRAFDRPNLATLFPTFVPAARFTREFPEAIQVGPVPPFRPSVRRPARARSSPVLWYPAAVGAGDVALGIVAGIERSRRGGALWLRSDRAFPGLEAGPVKVRPLPASSAADWARAWRGSRLAIVTGSRSLLEALWTRAPFLYHNGTLGRGRRRRRHRPEKIQALLRLAQAAGASREWRHDLDAFSRGQRVAEIVARQLGGPVRSPRLPWSHGFPRDRANGAAYVVSIARRFASAPEPRSGELVLALRASPNGGGPRILRV